VVAEQARMVMTRRVEAAGVVRPGVAGAGAARTVGPADVALVRLEETAVAGEVGSASKTWADMKTLENHYRRHGKDFGCTSENEYAADAAAFLQRARRERLPMKVDEHGVTRAYDPETDTFGSYSPDGKAYTFFKPRSRTYWDRQRGELQ
jgi:pyocin large subunit-like protein